MRLPLCSLVVVAVWATAVPARAADDVPLAQQAVILVRALAYDRDLVAGAAGTVDVVVVSRAGLLPAEKAAEKALAAFKALEKNTVSGLPVRVKALSYATADDLENKLEGADAVYIPSGADDDVDTIVAAARTKQVTTFAGKRSFLDKGVSLGVFVVGEKPTILVNVAASKAEGASFSSELFKIAQALK